MSIFTSLLQMSGINPYHDSYNPTALDDIDTSKDTINERYCILRIETSVLKDAIDLTKELNDLYFSKGGDNRNGYIGTTSILERIFKDFCTSDLDTIREETITEIEEELEREKE